MTDDDDISLIKLLDEITALLTDNGIGAHTIEIGLEPGTLNLLFENGQRFIIIAKEVITNGRQSQHSDP